MATGPADIVDNAARIARSFVGARRDGTAFDDYPGDAPATLDDAYRIQDNAIALNARAIVGWKVGRINPPIDGVDRLAGPIFDVTMAGADVPAMPVYAGGFAAAEAEFMLRIGTAPDPARRSYDIAGARALIDAVCVGIEIASSPFAGINDHGAHVTISDFGNNNGLVIGAAIPNGASRELNDWRVELAIGGQVAGTATAATMLDGPFGAARYLFEAMAARGIALAAGQWISSGAVTGVHRVAVGDRVRATFDDRLHVECEIKAQR